MTHPEEPRTCCLRSRACHTSLLFDNGFCMTGHPFCTQHYRFSMATINSLPEELCVTMVEELDLVSLIQLSQTSRLFRRLCNVNDALNPQAVANLLCQAHAHWSYWPALRHRAWKATIVRCCKLLRSPWICDNTSMYAMLGRRGSVRLEIECDRMLLRAHEEQLGRDDS